jgi:hypothetical protein
MKQFTVFTSLIGLSFLTLWAFFQADPAPKYDNHPIPVYDATGEMLKAVHAGDQANVPVTGVESRIAPVYDATGAMLEAINPNKEVVTVPAYDATAAMLKATQPDTKVTTVPAYDATGKMLEAISP